MTLLAAGPTTAHADDTNGNLTVVQDPNGYTTVTYDKENRLTLHQSGGVYASYSYDAIGRMTSMTNPSGEVTSWTYLDNDWLKTQTLQNGLVTTNTLDALGRVTRLLNAVSGATVSDFNSMNFDGVGSRTSLTASVPGHTSYSGNTTWGYDVNSRVTSEVSARAGSFSNSFGYDGAGNPTSFKGAGNTFNSNNQNSAYTWDNDGNPTTYKGAALTFDAEDRLTSTPCTGGTLTAGYRGDNMRGWKNTPSGRTYFVYDGIEPVLEVDSGGNVTAINTYGVAGLTSRHTNAGISTYYAFDNQGSVAERLDGTGAVTSHSVYDAYGAFSSTAAPTDPFGYEAQQGYYTDNETGLIALAFRYYDPSTGRFLNREPIGMAGGVNVYGYTQNRPTSGVDPGGTDTYKITYNASDSTPYYGHAYLNITAHCKFKTAGLFPVNDGTCLGLPCAIFHPGGGLVDYTPRGGKRQGNPDYPGIGGINGPGRDPTKYHVELEGTGWAFDNAICKCISHCVKVPPDWSASPIGFYVCGSWADDMVDCARLLLKGFTPGHPRELKARIGRDAWHIF